MNKKIALVSALAICAGILSGCSGSTDSESRNTSAESTSNATSSMPVSELSEVENSASQNEESSNSQNEESSTPSESEQTEVKEQTTEAPEEQPGSNAVQNVSFTVSPVGVDKASSGLDDSSWIKTQYRVMFYIPADGTYFATYTDPEDSWTQHGAILNSDFSLKETLNERMLIQYGAEDHPYYYYEDKNENYILTINGKKYTVDRGKLSFSDNLLVYQETYYTFDGDILDIPYHGDFCDGYCFYTEDGKTLCMDKSGNITDYTEKVKPITDKGQTVTALIDNTYFVADNNIWYDADLNELGNFGEPRKAEDGKYSVDGLAYVCDSFNTIYIVELSTGKKMFKFGSGYIWGSDYAWSRSYGMDSSVELRDSEGHLVYDKGDFLCLSGFYNGIALAATLDGLYFVNMDFDIVSEKVAGRMNCSVQYIGNGQFMYLDGDYMETGAVYCHVVTPEF